MKRVLLLMMGALLLLSPMVALADDTPAPAVAEAVAAPAAPETATADLAVVEDPPANDDVSWDELADLLLKVITDWRTLGWMAGVIALIALFTAVLRLKPLNDLLEKHGLKHIKVYVAMGLGGALIFFTTLAAGKSWWEALIAAVVGVVAGFATTGGHQAITKGNKKKP